MVRNGYKTDRVVLAVALQVKKRMDKRRREYEEECERSWRQGYRPHYCVHGTNMWTDYDNICGPCEVALGPYEEALMVAHRAVNESNRRRRVMKAFTDALAAENYSGTKIAEMLQPVVAWVLRPIEDA